MRGHPADALFLAFLLALAGRAQGAPELWNRLFPKTAPEPEAVDYRDVTAIGRFVPVLDRPNRLQAPLPLDVIGPAGEAIPLRGGVPFPAGAITRPQTLRLRDQQNQELPLQTRVLSYWPDGSVRWLLLDTILDLPTVGRTRLSLADGETPRLDIAPLAVQDDHSIRLATAGLEMVLPRRGMPRFAGLPPPLDGTWELIDEADGTVYRASEGTATSRIVETGPVRATVMVSGTLAADGKSPLPYDMEVSLTQGVPALVLRPIVWRGDVAGTRSTTSLTLGANTGLDTLVFGGEKPSSRIRRAGESFQLRQSWEGYEAKLGDTVLETGNRSAGWVFADGLCLAVPRFGQFLSQTLSVENYGFLIVLTARGNPFEVVLEFGMAGTWEAQRLARRLAEPALLHPGAKWLAQSGGLGALPFPIESTAELDQLCERAERLQDFHRQWARTGKRKWLDASFNQPFSWIPDLVARYLFTGDQLALLAAAREGHDEHPALADLYGTTWNPVLLDQMRRNNWNQPPEEHLRERLLRSVPFLEGGELRRLVDELERLAQRQLAYEAYPEKRGLQGSATSGMIEALTFLHGTTGKEIYRDLAETLYDILVEEKTIPVNVRSLLAYAARRQVPPPGPDTVAPPQADAAFLISCQNDDGGFGLAPGFPSDLDSTYRAVDSLRLLGVPVPQARRCAAWIAACRLPVGGYANRPGGQDPEVAWTCFALHSLALLGVPPPELERTVAWLKDGFQTDERWNCSDDSSSSTVAHAVLTLALLGETAPDPFAVRSFLLSRQIDRGGFADESRAQTATTALVLNALRQQGGMDQTKGLLAWLASLRRHDGGYGWPDADHSSLANTTHVLSCLSALSASLTEQELSRTRRFVRHCRSATGGFANRPGRTPTVLHTWYGVRAAAYLGPEPTP